MGSWPDQRFALACAALCRRRWMWAEVIFGWAACPGVAP
jgi:hypothetical protein